MYYFVLFATLIFFNIYSSAQAQWTDGMNATYVMGQSNFTSRTSGNGTEGMDTPIKVAIDLVNNKIYVVDLASSRVLRFSYPLTGNQPTAELVFGQADFTSTSANRGGTVAANTLNLPYGVAVHNGTLWIADASNHRVLKFNNAHSLSSNGPNADVVLGQASFTANSSAVAQNRMNLPRAVAVDSSGNLWVADQSNNRVLRFDNAASKSSGANADGVLGQSNFTTNTATTTQSSLGSPFGLAVDGDGRLWVAQITTHRVTWYNNAAAKTNGANADGVLGQANFTSGSGATTQSRMNFPRDVAISPAGRLFVATSSSNRVVIYNNAASKSNGANADNVLGQSNFTSSSAATTQSGMNNPYGVAITPDGKLFVADAVNNRVTMFEGTDDTPLPVELVDFSLKAAGKSVNISWKTASEVENAGFELYRSSGGENSFKKIASYITDTELRGLGSSAYGKNYFFNDEDVAAGEYWYKLVDVAYDGTRKEHEAKSILVQEASSKDAGITLSPNPASEFLKV
ncbi:MAG TPA: NHL repeat-containing protein, partial [Patescibacteria group bacterium]|nr:NHL repeat-containing protein [Patescibacteria group bacterium]